MNSVEKYIYADNNATVPVSKEHLSELFETIAVFDGNPSTTHYMGRNTKLLVEKSREQVAQCLGAKRKNLIFTSGATESNNLALQGFISKYKNGDFTKVPTIAISAGEHSALKAPCRYFGEIGSIKSILVGISRAGAVDCDELFATLENTAVDFLSLILVNNETGIFNPVEEIVPKIKSFRPDIHLHIDAVQALGKIDLQWVHESQIDSMAISGHKIGSLKGIGALYLKSLKLIHPVNYGGGQERALRPGTESVEGIISFGLKAKDVPHKIASFKTIKSLRDQLASELRAIPGIKIHGDDALQVGNVINLHWEGHSSDPIIIEFENKNICVSSGSACSSGSKTASSVLLAMGLAEEAAANSIRISLGESNTTEDIKAIANAMRAVCTPST